MARLHTYDEDLIFHYVDQHAEKAIGKPLSSFCDLVDHLSEVIPQDTNNREVLLARGFLVWCAAARRKGFFHLIEHRPDDELFQSFCQSADIECQIITGNAKCKPIPSLRGEVPRHRWCAFKAGQIWHFVDPFWCLVAVKYSSLEGVVSLESDGNTRILSQQCPVSTKVFYAFRKDWFCTDPDVFMHDHFTNDQDWQLVWKQCSFETWLNMSFLRYQFFQIGLRLLSGQSSHLQASNGKATIQLIGKPEIFNQFSFRYNLYLNKSDAANLSQSDLPRLVCPSRETDIFKFEIRCPVAGTYFLEINAHELQTNESSTCAAFKISCDKPDPTCRVLPVDTGIMGFGFGPSAEEAGLKNPSVKGSKLVLKSTAQDQKERQTISFKIDADAVNEREYEASLIDGKSVETVPTVMNQSRRRLEITPPTSVDGERALVISHRQQRTKQKFEPALYYLISEEEDGTENDDKQTLQKKKEVLHEMKMQEKMEKNSSLKEKLRRMKEAISRLAQPSIKVETDTDKENSETAPDPKQKDDPCSNQA